MHDHALRAAAIVTGWDAVPLVVISWKEIANITLQPTTDCFQCPETDILIAHLDPVQR